MMKNIKSKKGFTLVELIVVIAIIGILSAVLVPNIMGYIEKSRLSSDMQDVAMMNRLLSSEAILDDVAYYEGYEVQDILGSKGYNLVPKSSTYSYWYDRASNKMLLLNRLPIKSDSTYNGIIFRNDRVEAISYDCPSLLYVDQRDNNIRRALELIRDCLILAKSRLTSPYTSQDVLNKIDDIFTEVLSMNVLSNSLKDHIRTFSLTETIYVDNDSFYTKAQPLNGLLTVNRMIISNNTTSIPSFSNQIDYAPKIQILEGKVTIPKSVINVNAGAFTNLQSNIAIYTNSRTIFNSSNLNSGCTIVTDFNTNQTMIVPIFYEIDLEGNKIGLFSCKQDKYIAVPKGSRFKFDIGSLNITTEFKFETSLSFDDDIGMNVLKIILIDKDNSIFAKGVISYYEI